MRNTPILLLAGCLALAASASAQRLQSDERTSTQRSSGPLRVSVRAAAGGDGRTITAQVVEQGPDGIFRYLQSLLGWSRLGLPDVKVDLDLRDADARTALEQVCKQAGLDLRVEDGLDIERKATIVAKGVPLSAAIDALSAIYQVSWMRETRDGKTIIRIGKRRSGLWPDRTGAGVFEIGPLPGVGQMLSLRMQRGPDGIAYVLGARERRASFECPHCKGKVTLLHSTEQVRCAKCGVPFQENWQFCPRDGARRPASQPDVRFCPLCGKEVKVSR